VVTLVCILPGLLDLASPIAANAIFSLCAIALDTSYIIPIFCRRWYSVWPHPEVPFQAGPFVLRGALGWVANVTCIVWTCFIVVIFSLPNLKPVTPQNMNYASVITVGVVVLSGYVQVHMLGCRRPAHEVPGCGMYLLPTSTTRDRARIWRTIVSLAGRPPRRSFEGQFWCYVMSTQCINPMKS
jgi:hypothetical protein